MWALDPQSSYSIPISIFKRQKWAKKYRRINVFINATVLVVMDGGGFEPPKALLTDLQSAPFGHSGTHPKSR